MTHHELPPQPEEPASSAETEQVISLYEQEFGQAALEVMQVIEPARQHYRSYAFDGLDDALARALGLEQ